MYYPVTTITLHQKLFMYEGGFDKLLYCFFSPHGSQISSMNSRQSTQEYNSDIMPIDDPYHPDYNPNYHDDYNDDYIDDYDGDYETPTIENIDRMDRMDRLNDHIDPKAKVPSPARIRWIGAFQKVC